MGNDMRIVFRKLYRQQALNEDEYSNLMYYIDGLRITSPESYTLFYERFAIILFREYHIYIPRFAYGMDDVYDYLINNPSTIEELKNKSSSVDLFPLYLHEYLEYSYPNGINASSILTSLEIMKPDNTVDFVLPEPRQKSLVYKYESANPYKEPGLKNHFDRIGRYSFVSRLQSIRHLYGNKASDDKIELISDDCLGGIFTNKEKSIYYYIYLTERDSLKASNACRMLNMALYEKYAEG
jgi:hypothetical protein